MPVTQREYLLTHHQIGGSQSRQEDDGKGIKPIPPTNGLQNQLAKRANSSLSSKEVSRVHTGGLTQPWSLSARPDACFCSSKEERTLAAAAGQGWSGEDPRNKWFQQLLETSPEDLLPGQWARSGGSLQPSRCGALSWPRLNSGKPWSQLSSPTWGTRNCNWKCLGPAAHPSKADKEARLVERKASFTSEASNSGEGGMPAKAESRHWWSLGKSSSRWREGANAGTAPSALPVILKLVLWWSGQV